MFVAMVTVPGLPASETTSASRWCILAFSTWCLMPRMPSILDSSSLISTVVVPTSTGRPCLLSSTTSSMTALSFSRLVLYTRSSFVSARWAVGRDDHDVQFVDVPKLARLRFRRSGHASQLVVHPEVILQRHRGVRLRGRLHLHALFGLNGLVQSVAVTTTFHDAAGLLVDDLHLVVHDDVLDVLFEQCVCLQSWFMLWMRALLTP